MLMLAWLSQTLRPLTGLTTYDDLWRLDTDTMVWRGPISPRVATAKDRPEKTMAHAAATYGKKLYVFGGQHGRNLLQKLFVLALDEGSRSYSWTRVKNDSLPSARAGHCLAAVETSVATPNDGLYLFGGQGKKLLNDLHRLDPGTGLFKELQPTGRQPAARRGMSLVYDGLGSLICFGGANSSSIDNALSVFSLQRNEWSHPTQLGQVPTARTNHSAVLIAPGHVLIFGGCNAQGQLFNDAYVLDTMTFTWHRPNELNRAPAPRYHHRCCFINGRTFLYGGINSKQTFDGIAILDTKFTAEVHAIADEIQSLTRDSDAISRSTMGSSASTEVVRQQLADLLYKRSMEEAQQQALRHAEAAGDALEATRREELRMKVLLAEAEAEAARAMARAREAEARAQREVAALAVVRTELEASQSKLAEVASEAERSKRQNEDLVKELGLVSSRCVCVCRGGHQPSAPEKPLKPISPLFFPTDLLTPSQVLKAATVLNSKGGKDEKRPCC